MRHTPRDIPLELAVKAGGPCGKRLDSTIDAERGTAIDCRPCCNEISISIRAMCQGYDYGIFIPSDCLVNATGVPSRDRDPASLRYPSILRAYEHWSD